MGGKRICLRYRHVSVLRAGCGVHLLPSTKFTKAQGNLLARKEKEKEKEKVIEEYGRRRSVSRRFIENGPLRCRMSERDMGRIGTWERKIGNENLGLKKQQSYIETQGESDRG